MPHLMGDTRNDRHIGGAAFRGHWDNQTPMTAADRQAKARTMGGKKPGAKKKRTSVAAPAR